MITIMSLGLQSVADVDVLVFAMCKFPRKLDSTKDSIMSLIC